jgi:probable HAF family extracellular repeat protein
MFRRLSRRTLSLVAASAILGLAACGKDADSPVQPFGGLRDASITLSDGANAGNPHFYFLPPLVPQPKYSGISDGTLSPRVTVCEWNGSAQLCGAIVASFGSEAIRYDAASQHYILHWRTEQLDPSKSWRLRVHVGATELGAIDVALTKNSRTIPVKFRIERGAVNVVAPGQSAEVGSAGGAVTSADGGFGIDIPAGALSGAVGVTGATILNVPDGAVPLSPAYDFGPDGTTFDTPVTITMKFDRSALPAGVPDSAITIFWLNDGAWDALPGATVNAADGTVSAQTTHFSVYRVMWIPTATTPDGRPTAAQIPVGGTVQVRGILYNCPPNLLCNTPAPNVWVDWTPVNANAIALVPLRSRSDAAGNFSTVAVGRALGFSSIRAKITSATYEVWQVSVMEKLKLFSSHGTNPNLFEDATRDLGLGHGLQISPRTSTNAPAPVQVTLTQSAPNALNGLPGGVTIPAGTTGPAVFTAVARTIAPDTVIASAPGYLPDTLVVRVAPGRLTASGYVPSLTLGDSVRINIVTMNPTGLYNDPAYSQVYALGGTNVAFSVNNVRTNSISIPDGATGEAFWVIGTGVGNAFFSVTGPQVGGYGASLTIEPPPVTAEIAAGGKSACLRKLDGSVFCWGDPAYGATDAPSGTVFTTVGGGFFHYCGIRADQTIACWGNNSDLRAQPPAGAFAQISTGPESNCALRADGTASCWGFGNDGRISVPAGSYSQLSTGWYHGCAIRQSDATVVCWGRNDMGQSTPPAGTFTKIEASSNTSCGIRTDQILVCWGAIGGTPSGTFRAVGHTVGGGHFCAIRSDRTLACWGDNSFGQATPPSGQFVQVSGGQLHSCGIRTNGTGTCWGIISSIPAYTAQDLGTAAGVNWAEARTVNLAGRIVGWGGNGFPSWQGWAYETNVGIRNMGNPCGDFYMSNDINAAGTIAMSSAYCAYLFTPGAGLTGGTITNVPAPAGTNRSGAVSLNDNGLVLACADNGQYAYNYVWNRNTNAMTVAPGGPGNHCRGKINNAGLAILNGETGGAYLWNVAAGTMTPIPGLAGFMTYAMDINDNGVVVGRSCLDNQVTCRGWRWSAGQAQLELLGNLGGGNTAAFGINNAGQVVGWSSTGSGQRHAFVLNGSTMTDLGAAGFNESVANDINDNGVIVGAAGHLVPISGRWWNLDWIPTGVTHAMRWRTN